MKQLKRIKVRESINLWNKNNPKKNKKTALTISNNIGINNRNLSLWGKEAPKQVKALSELSILFNCSIDDLFLCDGSGYLIRIKIHEFLIKNELTFLLLSFQISNSSESRLRLWNDGQIPFAIRNFFKFCKDLEIRPSQVLEY